MNIFFHILSHNVIPIGIMILLGAFMQRRFTLDIKTFTKLIFYIFTPAMMFKMLYESEISATVWGQVMGFLALFTVLQYAGTEVVLRLRGHQGGMKSAMRNSVLFYNSANYAIPLNQLVFAGNPNTMAIQLLVMLVQSLLPQTYGVYAVNAHKGAWRKTMRTILGMPVIYAIPLGVLFRELAIPIPKPVYEPLTYLNNGYIGLALLTLGVQLGQMKWKLDRVWDVAISNGLRLIGGPLLGVLLVHVMGLEGLMAQTLILSCAVPTSLVSMLLAVEFDNEPEFASQAVFSSTVISMFTVTIVIALLPHLT